MPTGDFFATFVSGLEILPVDVTVTDGVISAEVPATAEGQSYVFLTSDKSGNVTDATILAGKFFPSPQHSSYLLTISRPRHRRDYPRLTNI